MKAAPWRGALIILNGNIRINCDALSRVKYVSEYQDSLSIFWVRALENFRRQSGIAAIGYLSIEYSLFSKKTVMYS